MPAEKHDIQGLAEAAEKRGHEVTVFFNEESVQLLAKGSGFQPSCGNLLACRTSLRDAGLKGVDLNPKARESSLGELVDLLEKSDRVVFLD